MSLKFSLIVIAVSFSISAFAKPSKAPTMELLWPHTFEKMPKAQQKDYADQIRKAWLDFEKSYPIEPNETASFWQKILFETAFAADAKPCLIGGNTLAAVKGPNGYQCPTKLKPCGSSGNEGFECGPIFSNSCISRTPVASISERCYQASTKTPLNANDYKEIVYHINQDFTEVCVKKSSRGSTDGCAFLAKKFTDITTKHRIKIDGLSDYTAQQAALDEDTKQIDEAPIEAESMVAEESAPEKPVIAPSKLIEYGIGPGGRALSRQEVEEIMGRAPPSEAAAANDPNEVVGSATADAGDSSSGTSGSRANGNSVSKTQLGAAIRQCNMGKHGELALLPRNITLAKSCAFDNNRAILAKLDEKGCSKKGDKDAEYLFITRITGLYGAKINNYSSNLLPGVIYDSEAVKSSDGKTTTYHLKMLAYKVERDKRGATPVDQSLVVEQTGNRYYLKTPNGRSEVKMDHAWRKTFISSGARIEGNSNFSAEATLQGLMTLGNECELVSDIKLLKQKGLALSPDRSRLERARGAM